MADQVTKVTKVLPRADGSEVRIVATACFGAGLHRSIDVVVHRRATPQQDWAYCSDQPHPDWRKMSVAEYCQRGRSEMLQAVAPGEIMAVTRLIGQPIDALPAGVEVQH